jgi:GT2 family glycosyltransferase
MNTAICKPATLSVSCVIYDTDFDILATTIESLYTAVQEAIKKKSLNACSFYLINNHPATSNSFQQAATLAKNLFTNIEIINGHGNIGYGRANNLAINKSQSELHLILNPDVKIDAAAIDEGIRFLAQNPDVDLVAPDATNNLGENEYLAKRMPNPLIIFLRGINNTTLNRVFKKQLDWYTYRDKLPTSEPLEIELASGCFMLCRTKVLKDIGGFSPKYFLYFEDFDLSLRIAKKVLLPSMKIIHLGGKAAKKGSKHIQLFISSYLIFLRQKRSNQ